MMMTRFSISFVLILRKHWRLEVQSLPRVKRIAGFTLIELSIVLVIIGLIVGGVLVGQDLIKAAEVRAQVAQIEETNAAVNTFRLKYNGLPGDLKNATTFFSAGSQPEQVTNGNGDKRICGYVGSGSNCNAPAHQNNLWGGGLEWHRAFDHLAASGLVNHSQYDEAGAISNYNLPGTGFPEMKIRTSGVSPHGANGQHVDRQGCIAFGYEPPVGYNSGGHRIKLGAGRLLENTWNVNITGFNNGLNPDEAYMLDSKIDDGKPYSGNTVTMAVTYSNRIPGWSGNTIGDGTTNCGTYATNSYLPEAPNNGARSCLLSIKAGF